MHSPSECDWAFTAQPNPHLNGRAIPLPMGKVLGGGSSINVMAWARGHRSDWDSRVTTGNTMAACIVIGERAGEMLRTAHKL